MFWIYGASDYSMIHAASCSKVGHGNGWQGPYATQGAAYDAAAVRDVPAWNCGHCRPIKVSQTIQGKEVAIG